jgi:phosphoribosylanthranilate isomerase
VTAVKICGLTRSSDVELACALGAAYVGFNFSTRSPRRVTVEAGRRLADATLSHVLRVGVFVEESYEAMAEAADAARLDLVQIHRNLREEDLRRAPRPVLAVAAVDGVMVEAPEELLPRCRAVLFDSNAGGRSGGTGAPFDWSVLEQRRWPVPVFLAGGLGPANVGEVIRRLRPAAVDVASGVERSPGIKDPERMERFFAAVREADREAS